MPDPSMQLPAGKTCGSCAHVERCAAFGFSSRGATTCDFAPSRFVERVTPIERPRGAGYVSRLDPPPGDPRAAHRCKKGEPCRCAGLGAVPKETR
jgi:hypothetical protein